MGRTRRSEGSVTKKRGLWYAVITVRRDANGAPARQWSQGFRTRKIAERALAQLLIDGRRPKESSRDVRTVVTEYITHDVTPHGRRSPTTTQRYRGLLANMSPILQYSIDRLDGSTIERFYNGLLEGGLSPTTVHHVHNLLFAAFRWAKSKRVALISRNPFEDDAVEKPRRRKSGARSLTVQQAQRAVEALSTTKHGNALLFTLGSGIRRGETCGLKWDSVDVHRRVVIICESRYQVHGEQGQKSTKADRIREVPLNRTALRALQLEKTRQEEWRITAGDLWHESGHVFTDEFGNPLSPMALTNAFGRCARRAGLPTKRMHDLRHTAATFILSGSGNASAASAILGHSDKSTTLRLYGHVIDRSTITAVEEIDKALAITAAQT